MNTQDLKRTKVLISYSHRDKEWLERLRIHLIPLERDFGFDIWDDTRIRAGSRWREEIRASLELTKVAVLLVSANFLASDFISTNELPSLLKAAEEQGTLILPVILSPSRFLKTEPLCQFQAVNNPSEPLINMSEAQQQAIFVKIADHIETSLGLGSNPTLSGKGKPRLMITSKNPIVLEISSDEVVLGREEGNIRFPESLDMSALHARIMRRGQNFFIIDENSLNGIFKQISGETELKDGDTIMIGFQSLRMVRDARGAPELYISETGSNSARIHKIDSYETVIGQTIGQIQFPNKKGVAPRHAHIIRRDERLFIVNENPTFYTFLRVRGQAELRSGDMIILGSQILKFVI